MKTERKMLISIALIFIMLLNCMMPILSVYATTVDEIVLNSALYQAVKKSLTDDGYDFSYDDDTLTIKVSTEVIPTITEMNLNNSGISDLTGLAKFTGLVHLEISGNSLSKDSNLAELNSLTNLNYLDLSTNNIEDVTAIDSLISAIEADGGRVILTSQDVTINKIVVASPGTTINVEFPKILLKGGQTKDCWRSASSTGPTIKKYYTQNYAFASMDVDISSEGLLQYVVYIHDDPTEAAKASNTNPAATNPLKESVFRVNVIAHLDSETGIYLPDSNLYREVKKQLTSGMEDNPYSTEYRKLKDNGNTYNKDIASYPYKVDFDGNIIYDECMYYVDASGRTILTVDGEDKYILNALEGKVYDMTGDLYTYTYERAVVEIENPADGTMTYKNGYKVAVNGENDTLYRHAYDVQQVLVIDNLVLMNKITSLLLNNKQIRDLSGIEWFVGLKSSLDVSQNYLSNIDPIYSLQTNKDTYEDKLQATYTNILKERAEELGGNLNLFLTGTTAAKAAAESNENAIQTAVNAAVAALVEAAKINSEKQLEDGSMAPDPEYATKMADAKKKVEEALKLIYNHRNAAGEKDDYNTLIEKNLDNAAENLEKVYDSIDELYEIYTNQYKLLTLLSDDMNYMDFPEYITYEETKETEEGRKTLVTGTTTRLTAVEGQKGFTALEKELLEEMFWGVDFDDPEATLSKYFADHGISAGWLEDLRMIALISEMANYCTIKRICDETTISGSCYAEDYLRARIKEFKDDSIDTSLEEELLFFITNIKDYETETTGNSYIDIFVDYYFDELAYESELINKCEDEYEEVTDLLHELVAYANFDEIRYLRDPATGEYKYGINAVIEEKSEVDTDGDGTPDTEVYAYPDALNNMTQIFNALSVTYPFVKDVNYFEEIMDDYNSEANKLYLYDEAVAISTRLVNGNVERYVYLPTLKALDISYNADLTGIERLGELTNLRELSAASNYIGDISNVDWNAIKYLRKLDLSQNFITDITPVDDLVYLEYLNASRNLISGAFNFDFTASQKYLKNLDLSYNQLDDITEILYYLDLKVGSDYANYLAREDTLNINLNNQQLEIVVDKTTFLPENPTTVNVDLPKIFTQLLAIDTERTTFGLTSLDGRVESEGRFVTLDTRTMGDKTGTVSVLADAGYTTCVGMGTTATIKYKVDDRTVSEVVINPTAVEMAAGETQTFTAEVKGNNLLDTTVVWSLSGALSADTKIENGVLTLGADETATSITVTATSNYDNSKSASAVVTVVVREILTFDITPDTADIIKGESANFTVIVDGNNLRPEDKEFDIDVESETSANTKVEVDENGNYVLTVGEDETATAVTLKITSKRDNTRVDTSTINVLTREVTGVTVTPNAGRMEVGSTATFQATVTGNYLTNFDKNWTVEGATSPDTKITKDENGNGILVIGADETSTSITVRATSDFDNTKSGAATIVVFKRTVSGVTVSSQDNIDTLEAGNTLNFTAVVDGTDLDETTDKTVTWSISGNNLTGTKVENGVLTVDANETSTSITVRATSDFDTTKFGEKTITVYRRLVTGVTITPSENVEITKGETLKFTETVEGNEHLQAADKTVTWSIAAPAGSEKALHEGTTIDQNGNVTVSKNEENTEIIVTAKSNFDGSKVATVKVTLKAYQPNVGLGYTVDADSILGVATNMPVDAFKAKLAKDYKVVVKTDGDTKEEVTEGIMKTGMWVYVYAKDDTEMKTPLSDGNGGLLVYQVVVKGDANGDGVADGLDSNAIKAHINEVEGKTLTGVYFKAADISGDNEIDVRDTKLLLYHIAEVDGYTFDYVAQN